MSNLAVIDLDGVVAESSARFEQATTNGKVNWNMALNGEHVHLDVPIVGAADALVLLEQRGYAVVFLTSRPDHMRAATLAWLRTHDVKLRRLEMKPASEQYTKTKAWKSRMVGDLAREYRATEILLVEDEQANVDEIIAKNTGLPIVWFESLSAAIAAKGE